MQFGFYPRRYDRVVGPVEISTLPDLESKIEDIFKLQKRDWIHAADAPIRNERVFGLPKTHELRHTTISDENYLRFLIQCFGFLVGMRMSDSEAGFLDATPVKIGTANDIVWHADKLEAAVEQTDHEWGGHAANPRLLAAMRGTIHCYFISCTPSLLEYERFIYLYTAIEGCHYVHCTLRGTRPTSIPHSRRIEELCNALSMPVPPWADATSGIVAHRNSTLHEGLFFDEPLGFQIFGGNKTRTTADGWVLLEMQKLTSRFVVALLGMPKKPYVSSVTNDRQRHLFE